MGALQQSVRFLSIRAARGKESSWAGKAEAGLGSGGRLCPFPIQLGSQGSSGGFGCFALGWRNGLRTLKSRSLLGASLSCRKVCG